MHGERLLAPLFETPQVVVEPGRVCLAADLDDHIVMMFRLLARGCRRALDVERHRVAVLDAAAFHGLVAGRAILQLRQRLLDRVLLERHRGPPQRNGVQRPGIDGRERLERGRKRQRLSFVERHVLHVWRVDGLQAALAQHLVDGARDQIVRDVVKNLLAEPLLDERRRNLALAEPRYARLPAVAAGYAIDFGVDDVAGNFHGNALLGFSEIGEFGFHYRIISAFRLRAPRYGGQVATTGDEAMSRACTPELPLASRASEGVRKGGVEPPRPFGHRILSPARLPVPPLSPERILRDLRVPRPGVGTAVPRHSI